MKVRLEDVSMHMDAGSKFMILWNQVMDKIGAAPDLLPPVISIEILKKPLFFIIYKMHLMGVKDTQIVDFCMQWLSFFKAVSENRVFDAHSEPVYVGEGRDRHLVGEDLFFRTNVIIGDLDDDNNGLDKPYEWIWVWRGILGTLEYAFIDDGVSVWDLFIETFDYSSLSHHPRIIYHEAAKISVKIDLVVIFCHGGLTYYMRQDIPK
jgi:hypothetical protein